MKIKIVYESKTGNTKLVAESIRDFCQKEHDVIFQEVKEALETKDKDEEVDLYFLGSWTNKGDCGDLIKEYCKYLEEENIAIFGTAGFGGSKEYYEKLADRFTYSLPKSNKILGDFHCQGKMPNGIRDRYVSMLSEHPEDKKLEVNIENFDNAQSHPDQNDLKNAKTFAKETIAKF